MAEITVFLCKTSRIYYNRAKISSAGIRLDYQNGYVPAFFNQGNSGSGVFGEEGLNTVVNSGTPLKVLNSWNYASKVTTLWE
ncbi:hypothetical protein [Mycoplasma struthionis]|uniref:Uncharacterized protein n=1 Tax=Mycoplasma struthionis TaxID=538220 RepID=A0A3G8LHY2_9MOLU|nr:hypothetical protein [Mycoplasma struthionis]AZG68957.1 hypothetical protein EGN60_03370 [Mycoplasma struthionis]